MVYFVITSPPIGGGRGIVMPMSVCLCVCVFVCVFVCNISAISQPIIMKFDMHIPVSQCPNPPGGAAGEVCHL